jgi:hypothetical protein
VKISCDRENKNFAGKGQFVNANWPFGQTKKRPSRAALGRPPYFVSKQIQSPSATPCAGRKEETPMIDEPVHGKLWEFFTAPARVWKTSILLMLLYLFGVWYLLL